MLFMFKILQGESFYLVLNIGFRAALQMTQVFILFSRMPFIGKMITWGIVCIIFYHSNFHTIQHLPAKRNVISTPNSVTVKEVIRKERKPCWYSASNSMRKLVASLKDTGTQNPQEQQPCIHHWVSFGAFQKTSYFNNLNFNNFKG